MNGWILYKRNKNQLSETDHGVNRLLDEAKRSGITLQVYNSEQCDVKIESASSVIYVNGEVAELPDFIIPRLGAETPYAALMLIRQLELAGVCCVNTSASVDKVRDKLLVAQLLQHNNLPIPTTMLLKPTLTLELINQQIGFPLVLKAISGARGIGICLCETAPAFLDLIGLLGLYSSDRQVLVQKFIANSYGRDLRVFVLGDKVIGCMQRIAKDSFKANYSLGGRVEYYPLTPEIEYLALTCSKLLGLEIAGIDLLFGEEGLLICEANSSPGFKGMELATGDDIATQILKYVTEQVQLKARGK